MKLPLPKKAVQTAIYTFSLGITVLIVGKLSNGLYFSKVIPLATAIILAGLVSALALIQKGRKADQECDERENRIQEKSMKASFYSMSVIIISFWSYNVAITGKFSNEMTLLLYLFFGSFYLAYLYYKMRM